MEYKKTLNMSKSGFPMRGGLPMREPDMLQQWYDMDLYHELLKKNEGKPRFALHDGPPFSNGALHMGHALNKCIKDFMIRSAAMRGYYTPYIPGWDNHGMPIESAIIKQNKLNRKQMSVAAFRSACHDFAQHYIDVQMEGFKRLGVLGDWEHPYKTMNPGFEAEEVKVFGAMYKKGYIYKGLKPVYWCYHDETALAEAEIEYQDDPCTTVYVKFAMHDDLGKLSHLDKSKLNFVIWTTTIWTLPGNLAIALHPSESYAVVKNEDNGEMYIVAEALAEKVMRVGNVEHYSIVETHPGSFYENMLADHPFLPKTSRLVLADYVTMDSGTGCVHTAPGFGADDYQTCRRYGMDMVVPVNDQGRHTDYAGKYEGMLVEESNPVILKDMQESGRLFASEEIVHSYPHCWRCKNPIIFRTTEQWFCSVDALKDDAVKACEDIKWIPGWGQERMTSMIRERSDWCISRQRVWGVPIPIFTCKKCGKPLVNEQTIKTVADLFREKGSNAWFDMTAAEILPAGTKCECGCSEFDKETDTMDVWFDSGSSWRAVIENREGQKTPVDVYLEGNDQYRGWFQSSMLTSIATQGKAPYKTVITHGMIVDEERQKMSKSLGNGIAPEDILKQYGADVMRLWVASSDYRQDMRISKEMLKHLSQNYLKIRNTARYILGNLFDFDPKTNAVAYADMPELDKWALMKLNDLAAKVREGYDSYEFHTVFHAIHNFCVVDMSNFYLDVIKDRLYCDETDGLSRRSAQTTIYRILSALVRMLSPILCFTADEIWQAMPHAAEDDARNVAYNEMPQADEALSFSDEDRAKWDKLTAFRDDVNKALEGARTAKTIGKPLEACVTVYADAEQAAFLNGCGQDLANLCIVSELDVVAGDGEGAASENLPGLKIAVARAAGEKCLRCWKQAKTVGSDAKHPGLCARCAKVVG